MPAGKAKGMPGLAKKKKKRKKEKKILL